MANLKNKIGAELRQEELLADWQLAQNGELPFMIEPLR